MNGIQDNIYKLRPHHVLCTLCFQGNGYNPTFINNFRKIKSSLFNSNETFIEISTGIDDICHLCPNKQLDNKCNTQTAVNQLDTAHMYYLNFYPGQIMSWKKALNNIKKYLTLNKFHKICSACSWKKLGICESVIKDTIDT